jgi:hypothetical protein
METLDTLQAKKQPSFQESLSTGLYLLEIMDQWWDLSFRGITADLQHHINISEWKITQASYSVVEWLNLDDISWSLKKIQEKSEAAQMLAGIFYFQPIPPEHIQKVSIESLSTEITRLAELKQTQSYKDRVDQILNEE